MPLRTVPPALSPRHPRRRVCTLRPTASLYRLSHTSPAHAALRRAPAVCRHTRAPASFESALQIADVVLPRFLVRLGIIIDVSVSELVKRELLLSSDILPLLALETARVLVGRDRLAVISHLGPSGGQLEIRIGAQR